jgi:hypothetical protein
MWPGSRSATPSIPWTLSTLTVRGEDPHFSVYTHPYAAYPSVRAAIEHACQAAWLVGPSNRNLRLTRRFRLLLTDAYSLDQVAALTPHGSGGVRATRLKWVEAIAKSRPLDMTECKSRVGYRTIIREAAEHLGGSTPGHSVAIWHALSGLSHGDQWASILTDRSEVAGSADGRAVTVRTTSSISNIANMMGVAVGMTEAAIRLFDRGRVRYT